jgi:hypothetical protein
VKRALAIAALTLFPGCASFWQTAKDVAIPAGTTGGVVWVMAALGTGPVGLAVAAAGTCAVFVATNLAADLRDGSLTGDAKLVKEKQELIDMVGQLKGKVQAAQELANVAEGSASTLQTALADAKRTIRVATSLLPWAIGLLIFVVLLSHHPRIRSGLAACLFWLLPFLRPKPQPKGSP